MEFGSFMEFHTREGRTQSEAFAESFAHVDMAEKLGLDTIWLAESHFNPERAVLSSPLVIGAAVAGRTKNIKIGTAVHVLPLGNPLQIAEHAATLDHVSEGRFQFGVGRSGLPSAYHGYNIPYSESRERFFEYLEIIITSWSKERFSYEGKYYSFRDVCLTPKPYQVPYPPVRIAATTSDTFTLLGRMGIPVFVGVRQLSLNQVEEQVKSYRRAWHEAGHVGPVDISLRVPVYVAESKNKALNDPKESFMRQFRRLGTQLSKSSAGQSTDAREQRAEKGAQLAGIIWDEIQGQKVAVGTPKMVIEQLNNMKTILGLSSVVAEFNAGELLSSEQVASSLTLFCNEVVPAFK